MILSSNPNSASITFGPVFFLELRVAVRRGRLNAFRCVYGGWLLWKASFPKLDKARAWVDEHERYGPTFVRSLASALRKHYQHLEEQRRAGNKTGQAQELAPPANVPR